MGVLNKEHLKYADSVPLIKSEIVHFTPSGVMLKNGRELATDYVICCTGYKTGIDKIVFEVDNRIVQWRGKESLFESIVSPVMPRMVFGYACAYDLGMKRSICLADHVMSMLVRYPDPRRIKNSTFGSRICNMNQGVNMDTSTPMLHGFLIGWFMLVHLGIISLYNLLGHMFGIFMFTRVRILQINHPKPKQRR